MKCAPPQRSRPTRRRVRRARHGAGYLPLDKLLSSNGKSLPITLEKGLSGAALAVST